MVLFSDLSHGKTFYMFNKYNQIKRCDIVYYPGSPTGFGFIHEDYMDSVYWITENELEKMFVSREDAEQNDLFNF